MSFNKAVFQTYSSQIVNVLCTFLSSIIIARMLGKAGQGELALYSNFVGISLLLLGFGLPVAITHFIAAQKINKKSILPLLMSVSVIGIFIISLFLLFTNQISTYYLPTFFYKTPMWYVLLLVYLFVLVINLFLNAILQGEQRFKALAWIGVGNSFALLSLYSIAYFKLVPISTFPWILGSMLLVAICQLIALFVQIFKTDRSYWSFESISFQTLKPLFVFSVMAFSTNLIQFLNYKMDVWFINYFFNDKSIIGIYSIAAMLAQILWLLPNALQQVFYAEVSSCSLLETTYHKAKNYSIYLAIYAILGGGLGYLLSTFLVPMLYGIEFVSAIQVIGILLFGIIPFCVSMPISAYFSGSGRVHINLYSAIIGFLFCLVGDIILIPKYDIIGAAWASVISYIATVLFLVIMFHSEGQKMKK